jgi:hypothetical protein
MYLGSVDEVGDINVYTYYRGEEKNFKTVAIIWWTLGGPLAAVGGTLLFIKLKKQGLFNSTRKIRMESNQSSRDRKTPDLDLNLTTNYPRWK